jgi:hypothetical protein
MNALPSQNPRSYKKNLPGFFYGFYYFTGGFPCG